MILTFPHMGQSYIPIKTLFDCLEIEYVMPPLNSRKMYEYSRELSPESICLPFRLILGNLIYGLDHGADTVFFGGSCGQCRQEYYEGMIKEVLTEMGYKFSYIHVNLKELASMENYGILKRIKEDLNSVKMLKAIYQALYVMTRTDKLFASVADIRRREEKKGQADLIMAEFIKDFYRVKGFDEIKKIIFKTEKVLAFIPCDIKEPDAKIAIVGEIYMASESFANLEIEKRLNNMGVTVHNYLGPGMWIREHFIKMLLPFLNNDKQIQRLTSEFVCHDDLGGHGVETVESIIKSAQKKFDGVIQVYPMGCMPEIIAKCTFDKICDKYRIPVMSLVLDEMTGEAGYMTRLEAFVDMIVSCKKRKNVI